ncbi:hypothetical protein PENARI_c086G03113 [Penicillium arizonense]|uniref:Uncharacterized protein n=1 Tax=Penicillium arizonense TaxID=1835702 RepID=A0A1F5L133_PENAI|nr:hypothetical protein PENARI_c086G03113 [Penicillium arizonense]OGE46933.1 hypothetical protein PENARI_c086G03113 [Penicillium arizonense]
MALTSGLSTLTMDGKGMPLCKPLITTSLRDDGTALLEPKRSLNSIDEKEMEPQRCTGFDASLGRIYRYYPVPTLVLDKDLCVVEVSDSHCTFSGQSRNELVGTCACDIPVHIIPASDTTTLYGALRAAIISKEAQIMEGIHVKSKNSTYQLRIAPIFEKSSLIYVILETQNTSKDHWVATESGLSIW